MGETRIRFTRASLTVEAAVVVPMMILLMLPFLYFLKTTLVYETVRFALAETADVISQMAYLYDRLGLNDIHRLYNQEQAEQKQELGEAATMVEEEWLEAVRDRMQDIMDIIAKAEEIITRGPMSAEGYTAIINMLGREWAANRMKEALSHVNLEALGVKDGIQGLGFSASEFFYQDGVYQDLIALVVTYEWNIPQILGFQFPAVSIQIQTRAFTGQPTIGSEDSGQDKTSYYYRIGEGNHYHSLSCYLIKNSLVAMNEEEAQQAGFSPCLRCRPEQIQAFVYVTSGGEHYHKQGCSYIQPDLKAVTEEEIQTLGLQPCELCQGGGGGFL